MLGADAPVQIQGFGEEAGGDEAGAIVHPALRVELSYARVDDGIAGAAIPPGSGGRVVTAPSVVAGAVVGGRGVGARGEDLVMEVAPGQLPAEGFAARR